MNQTRGGMAGYNGVVLHVMEGTLDGTDAWFRTSSAQASAHFGAAKDGRAYQWVDTADRAWAQAAGNRLWLSIECEGRSGDSLTPSQLEAVAQIVACCAKAHGFPVTITDDPAGKGIGWHGMGGTAWGGHPDCPGLPIKQQRPQIIDRAHAILNPQPSPPPTPTGDDAMHRITATVPTTDDQGNGYITLTGLAGRVVSVTMNGDDPASQGYPVMPRFAMSDRGADVLLVVMGAKPHTGFDVQVWVTG